MVDAEGFKISGAGCTGYAGCAGCAGKGKSKSRAKIECGLRALGGAGCTEQRQGPNLRSEQGPNRRAKAGLRSRLNSLLWDRLPRDLAGYAAFCALSSSTSMERSSSLSSGVFLCPCDRTACCTATFSTSSSLPEIAMSQGCSLRNQRQSIILRLPISHPFSPLSCLEG